MAKESAKRPEPVSYTHLAVKSGLAHTALFEYSRKRRLPSLPRLDDLPEILRHRDFRPAEFHPLCLCRRDSLRLSFPDVLTLVLRHKGQNLQHQIGNERPHQILAVAGIQQGHIQNADVDPALFCQYPPLRQNILIIPSQAVYA